MAPPVVEIPSPLDIYDSDSSHIGFYDYYPSLWDNGLMDELTPRIGHEKSDNAVVESNIYISYND